MSESQALAIKKLLEDFKSMILNKQYTFQSGMMKLINMHRDGYVMQFDYSATSMIVVVYEKSTMHRLAVLRFDKNKGTYAKWPSVNADLLKPLMVDLIMRDKVGVLV